ncbi:MAG: RIP metalloprotease RseP [Alphaproteobacteria bacterium]|nr:RIP metalloprotease RseP [Alphaproteobacteria bacterium]
MINILNSLLYPISFLLVISIIVIVHEGGHFYAARKCGVKVKAFSVGFGKVLFSRVDKLGTEWKVCLVPLGGYVQMLGDADPSSSKKDNEELEELSEEEKQFAFPFQKLWKKFIIVFAGPFMNYVFAIVLLTGIFRIYGLESIPPVVNSVIKDSVAEKIGIVKDDRFIKVNGKEISTLTDLQREIAVESVLNLVVLRDGKEIDLVAHIDHKNGKGMLGVTTVSKMEHIRDLNFVQSIKEAVKLAYQMSADTTKVLIKMIKRQRSTEDLRGPIGIAEISGNAMKEGILSFLLFVSQISIAIGFMNLLPIPVLDGGHLFFYIVEFIVRRPLNEKIEKVTSIIGLILLLGLVLLTSWNDIVRLIK